MAISGSISSLAPSEGTNKKIPRGFLTNMCSEFLLDFEEGSDIGLLPPTGMELHLLSSAAASLADCLSTKKISDSSLHARFFEDMSHRKEYVCEPLCIEIFQCHPRYETDSIRLEL